MRCGRPGLTIIMFSQCADYSVNLNDVSCLTVAFVVSRFVFLFVVVCLCLCVYISLAMLVYVWCGQLLARGSICDGR